MYVYELYTDCSENKNYFAKKKKKSNASSLSLSLVQRLLHSPLKQKPLKSTLSDGISMA